MRLIDCVGYMVPGAVGQFEDLAPRMVMTPWFDHEIPMTEAAEIGTRKVITDHSTGDTVGLFDSVVIYIPDDDEEQTIRLVTTLRQNALEGLISKESPVGKAVMGHRAGETVHVQVNEDVGYDIVIRSVEKGQDDDSLPISAY